MTDTPPKRITVQWTPEEWDQVARELAAINPLYLSQPGRTVAPREMRRAMDTLPPERRRPLREEQGASQFKARLNVEWDRIRGGSTNSPIITNEQPHPKRVFWTADEYVQMALWLRKRFPGQSYLESPDATGLELADIRIAMKAVLPPERHRHLYSITPLREPFVAAFKEAKKIAYKEGQKAEREARQQAQRKQAEEAERAAAEAAIADTPPPPAPPPAPTPSFPIYQPEGFNPADYPNRPDAPAPNLYESAFAPLLRPLLTLLAREFASALVPAMVEQAMPLLKAALAPQTPPPPPPLAATPVPPPAPETPAAPPLSAPERRAEPRLDLVTPTAPVEAKLRKPKVGILGLLPIQVQNLEAAFPGIEFVARHEYVKGPGQMAGLRGCERVIGVIKFINHTVEKQIRAEVGDRYVRVNGASSEVKRLVQLWINQGVIPGQPAAQAA